MSAQSWDKSMQDRILSALAKRWKTTDCLLCGGNRWSLNGFAHVSISGDAAWAVRGGKTLPSAAMVCEECGNTVIVNLVAIGVLDRDA